MENKKKEIKISRDLVLTMKSFLSDFTWIPSKSPTLSGKTSFSSSSSTTFDSISSSWKKEFYDLEFEFYCFSRIEFILNQFFKLKIRQICKTHFYAFIKILHEIVVIFNRRFFNHLSSFRRFFNATTFRRRLSGTAFEWQIVTFDVVKVFQIEMTFRRRSATFRFSWNLGFDHRFMLQPVPENGVWPAEENRYFAMTEFTKQMFFDLG